MSESIERERQIFGEALEMDSPEEQRAFVRGACGGDTSLQQAVEGLLEAYSQASGFIPPRLADASDTTCDPASSEPPGTIIGRYKLLQKIGEGGMGVVYMAEQEEPVRRKVALKIIKLGMDTRQVVARFEAERQALALMEHPNIAKVLDGGATETGRPYFVMELVTGVPITEFCNKNQLSTEDRLKLFIPVCQAIQSAHQKGIIHRDLKPTNILVTLNAGVPMPMVIDFGVAKATQQKLTEKTLFTQYATMIGTPAYMSPEQAEMSRLDVDTRSDIYGLGVLLYELLTGTTPFPEKRLRSASYQEMQRIILEEEPERPSTRRRQKNGLANSTAPFSTLNSQFSTDLDWIVMKCLEKDRARRYETANGLATDLKRHLDNELVLARPPSSLYRFQKAFRRNKLAYAAAIAVLIALIVGLGSATVMFFRERAALNGEQEQRLHAQSAQKVAETERARADAQARSTSESQRQSRRLLYASDMNLAQQALKQNNLGRTRQLLDRHRPQPGEEDLRGWEWRYLWQLIRSSALVTLTNRLTRGNSVSFSPDGTRLAVGWYDGCVDLWDVPSQRCVRSLTGCQDQFLGCVVFSPVRNLLAATSEPKTVTLYDLDSSDESILWRAPNQGKWEVHDLAFSLDGSKVAIYAGSRTQEFGDAVWVVNASSAKTESRYSTDQSYSAFFGAARLSPDNQRLYLARSDLVNYHYSIQCLDLTTGQEVWQTERQRDLGILALAVSPDGRVLASGSGQEDPTIHIWDAATGKLLVRLEGHTSLVSRLIFTTDGRRLISAAGDQTIRFWDTGTWTETAVFRGHTDVVEALAISEPAHLIASASKDGDLMLWKTEKPGVSDGYLRLPENVTRNDLLPLDGSRVMLCHSNEPPELFDIRQGVSLGPLPKLGSSSNLFVNFRTNWLCRWDGTNQILVEKWNGSQFIERGGVSLDFGMRPTTVAFNPARQVVAWSELTASNSVFLAALATPGRRIELRSEIAGLYPFLFSDDGKYLATPAPQRAALRVWNVDTGKSVVALNERVADEAFAVGGRILVAFLEVSGRDNEIRFYDLNHADRAPRRVPATLVPSRLAVSPNGRLVAATTQRGIVRLCDAVTGEWIEDLHGHMVSALGVSFSKDGRRLISASSGREAVKLWDVGTRQELLNLSGIGSLLFGAGWSADGDTILVGAPWQAWHAPSWEEIAATEAKDKAELKRP